MAKRDVTMPQPAAGPRVSAAVLWALVAVTLLLGFADLWRGGDTLAPLLLVLGYCVLAPLAILRS